MKRAGCKICNGPVADDAEDSGGSDRGVCASCWIRLVWIDNLQIMMQGGIVAGAGAFVYGFWYEAAPQFHWYCIGLSFFLAAWGAICCIWTGALAGRRGDFVPLLFVGCFLLYNWLATIEMGSVKALGRMPVLGGGVVLLLVCPFGWHVLERLRQSVKRLLET
jgi:hypothetical protein